MSKGACGHCCTAIRNLGVTAGGHEIIHDVNFSIHCGELTVLIGKNGAGKTTIIKSLLGENRYTGSIAFQSLGGRQRPLTLGYVPQKLNIDPNSPTTVYDFYASFLSSRPVFLRRSKQLYRTIQGHLEEFSAGGLIDRRLCDLSGGELQRVMLSLATHPVPELLLLDEPVSGIDQSGLAVFYEKLCDLKRENDLGILLISHDFRYISKYADRIVLIDKTVLCEGSPQEVFHSTEFREIFGEMGGF
jgi:ABC-type Mn2+/Zn2+ transport system ATPase subunit